jgi:DNA recombination protein RmuC
MSLATVALLCGLTLVLTLAVCILWMRLRVSRSTEEAGRRAAASEARCEELRGRLEVMDREFVELQQRLSDAESARSATEAKLTETVRGLQEQRTLLEDAKSRLSDAFKSLAADALAHNSEGFLTLAEQKFKALSDGTKTELDARRTAVAELIKPLNRALEDYQRQAHELEAKRLREISAVSEQLRALAQAQVTLQTETSRLVNALKSPQVRGRWGEIALRKTAELAGMSRHCDFVEQETVMSDTGRLRPDMIVRLPAGREVVVDSKVPLGGFMEALEAESEDGREQALARHAVQVKQHVATLASKEYWNQLSVAPEFVVMFIPNDSFLAAAAEQDPGLLESALTSNVVIATPTTFIALLRAIAFGWRQEIMAESAQKICHLGQELSDRMATVTGHLTDLGRSIARSVESYNATVGSFESRLLKSARKFKELGAEGKKTIGELPVVEQTPRALEVSGGEDDAQSGPS